MLLFSSRAASSASTESWYERRREINCCKKKKYFSSYSLFLVCDRERWKESTQHNWISVGNDRKNECVWFSCDCMLHPSRLAIFLSPRLSFIAFVAGCNLTILLYFNQCRVVHLCFYYFSISRQQSRRCLCGSRIVCEMMLETSRMRVERRSWKKKLWISSSGLHVVFRCDQTK